MVVNFWETKEWLELKSTDQKTEKILSIVEYLKMFGWTNYSNEKYREYLEVMNEKNTSNQGD
jgi:hypothetical protein